MQRRVAHRLNSLDNARHHLLFVNFGVADVDVENLRSCVNLTESLRQNIVDVVVDKRLLKELFACRVNALTDNARHINLNRGAGAANRGVALNSALGKCFAVERIFNFLYIFGGSAAAAAHHFYAVFEQSADALREPVGQNIIFVAVRVGKSCVSLDDKRQICVLAHLRHHALELVGTERTVDAERRNAQSCQRKRRRGRRNACKGSSAALKGHRGDYGLVGIFLRREHRRL